MDTNKSPSSNAFAVQSIIDIVAKAERDSGEILLQKINQEITISELGLMLRGIPEKVSEVIIRNCGTDYQKTIREISEGKTNPEMDENKVCFRSKYADYCANTMEKAIQKYLEIHKGLLEEGKI